MRKSLPESPRWLEAVGRTAEAEALMQAIEKEAAQGQPLPAPAPATPAPVAPDLGTLFTAPLLSRMIVGAICLITINTLLYGFVTWLPVFFVKQGLSVATSFGYSLLMALGAPIGAAIGALTADRWGRKPTIIGASLISMGCLILFLRVWQPRQPWLSPALRGHDESAATMTAPKALDKTPLTQGELWSALLPWIIVCVVMLIWGNGTFKGWANSIFVWNYPVPELHQMINKMPPVASGPTKEAAVFSFTYLSSTGTGMLLAAIISGVLMGVGPGRLVAEYGRTIRQCAISLVTISAMLAIGTLTRLSGVDATLGLAFAATGVLYPFFGTLLGWLGVALTGSDTSSNILFGNLQKITSEQLGLSPILMGAANSSGGVMGKMIDAQSIVVASTATNWYGHEGTILRFVFWHSIVLACLVGVLVTLQAYVWPFTAMVLK
jgi:L-lactate permease